MMSEKSWAERHPVLFGAVVGSVVPGVGTLAGAFGGLIYSMTEREQKHPTAEMPPLHETSYEVPTTEEM